MNQYDDLIDRIINNEIYFHFAKSGGHGGQNVNKRETKAELYFNIHDSQMLNEAQKARLIKLAGHRVHHEEQILIMTCEEERFQEANKEKVTHHFKELLMQALPEPKQRITTKVPKQSKEARLSEKKREGQKKGLRQKPRIEE